nr:hypothetical protein [Tanacetum cinerariifolium]
MLYALLDPRVKIGANQRPLLTTLAADETPESALFTRLHRTLADRERFYTQARLRHTGVATAATVVAALAEADGRPRQAHRRAGAAQAQRLGPAIQKPGAGAAFAHAHRAAGQHLYRHRVGELVLRYHARVRDGLCRAGAIFGRAVAVHFCRVPGAPLCVPHSGHHAGPRQVSVHYARRAPRVPQGRNSPGYAAHPDGICGLAAVLHLPVCVWQLGLRDSGGLHLWLRHVPVCALRHSRVR